MVLKESDVRKYYDRFGKKQDSQKFYEDPALEDLIAHASFNEAHHVFEFGCGTGRFAAGLLQEHLPPDATYFGNDLSETMVKLANERLAKYASRARVILSEHGVHFPAQVDSVDRVIANYVLDLLSESDIHEFLTEARRVLETNGKLCLVSLTYGNSIASSAVSGIWNWVFRLRASIVGGCRPIRLEDYLDTDDWQIEYQNVVIAYGVPSEVVVARVRDS